MRLIAVQEFPYANKSLKPGDPFEASDEDARILKGVGKAKDANESPESGNNYQTRDVVAEVEGQPASKPKRTYRRRDMRAENSNGDESKH